MSDDYHPRRPPWEPDPRRVGNNWTAMFDQQRGSAAPSGAQLPPPSQEATDDDAALPDLAIYRPWLLQRGRSRPPMMLGLRRFDPRSGQWIGWGMSYPSLFAVDYIGDRVLTLDFGMRQFAIEGHGLDELARRIKQGMVATILEYAASIWPERPDGPTVTAIRRVEAGG